MNNDIHSLMTGTTKITGKTFRKQTTVVKKQLKF